MPHPRILAAGSATHTPNIRAVRPGHHRVHYDLPMPSAISLAEQSVVPEKRTSTMRTDVQALRTVAVLAVLLYHLWPTRLTGGYVGVDIFFVISGYLIVSHILAEVARSGTFHLGRFWARRARRLLPASLLTLLATILATLAFVPTVHWAQYLREITASAFYFQNWRLAADAVDYSAAGNAASPVQHYWTLSAEEQFYVVIPLILAIGIALRRGGALRRRMFCLLAGIAAASFAYSVWLTQASPQVAYFSTASRAWEFALGALLAFGAARSGRRLAETLTWAGLTAIAVSVVAFTRSTTFPGPWAALPVAGTLLAIGWGQSTSLARVGSWPPVAMIARCSFAIYLWHFPLIIIAPYALGRPLALEDKVIIALATVAIAYASTTFYEDPMRFSTRLLAGRKATTVGLLALAGMLVVAGVAQGANRVGEARLERAEAQTAALLASAPDCLGAAAYANPGRPCHNPDLDGILVPNPAELLRSDANRPECWSTEIGDFHLCSLGPESGYDKHLLAVGDSHNNAMIGAYEAIAREHNWRIDVAGHSGCYWTDAEIARPTQDTRIACEQWRRDVDDYIASSPQLDAIVVLSSRSRSRPAAQPGRTPVDVERDGMVSAWAKRPNLSTRIIAIQDNPRMREDTLDCVQQEGLAAASACALPRSEAMRPRTGVQLAVALDSNARFIDTSRFFCRKKECSPVIGNVIVYRDPDHVTDVFASSLAPYLGEALSDALR
ncbi:peptidoglycan/LPS O-acetylase OafA/YrhL [Rarobacter faecitabidus]|uniref:Peptidoglycan/LPS O-acetylase OafA/YrhL n=2 Tax=Rarobacter faecitabidus TaxID=13243 RepID=A0A542ZU58_RARFA|nr:peptidoglycan/LPS O-acetylase OafA/YrhL [Rarobacter faecitabidus]